MSLAWEPVIGLEVHAELLTEAKIFCGCSARFGAAPNENTCPVCLGLPGVLPVPNGKVVDFALRLGLATNSRIARTSRWARKNYFYPDLPKGYQISQYELPICEGGYVEIDVGDAVRRIGLVRIHMEEDTGKNIHDARADASLVDFNRSGVPLLEIVSAPELRSPEEAGAYLRALRTLLRYLEICDGNMEEGSFRCDANVSVRPAGSSELGVKVEVKNMNSFRAVERALAYEIARQIDALESGEPVVQETRLWDPEAERTRPMRRKEYAHDYRYFPDPDLPPLRVDDGWIDRVRADLPELPRTRRDRLVRQYGLPRYDAEVLTARKDLADFFEEAVREHPNPKAISNWTMGEVLRVVRERGLDRELVIRDWPVPPRSLARLVRLVDEGKISGKIAKQVFEKMLAGGGSPEEIVEAEGLVQVSDESELERAIREVLASHADKVEEYRAGKEKLFGFFVGQAMKRLGGKAHPGKLNELLRRALSAAPKGEERP
ncbi:MAG: aspartyl/glutamyl-tRNA(Asn/Gln) amidotransferase subunit B [Candidatus Binatia bacterium]|nr:MAG: aspartyl/glutamyl-tRNA(Asn/Gln) amidotransferase subunit B [Candidatus Binatia bacterium]